MLARVRPNDVAPALAARSVAFTMIFVPVAAVCTGTLLLALLPEQAKPSASNLRQKLPNGVGERLAAETKTNQASSTELHSAAFSATVCCQVSCLARLAEECRHTLRLASAS